MALDMIVDPLYTVRVDEDGITAYHVVRVHPTFDVFHEEVHPDVIDLRWQASCTDLSVAILLADVLADRDIFAYGDDA